MLQSLLIFSSISAAAAGGLSSLFEALPFDAKLSPRHQVEISVGVYFEHLYKMNSADHTFDADFWLVQRWLDDRNYSTLFYDEDGKLRSNVELEAAACSSSSSSSTNGRHLSWRKLAAQSASGSSSPFEERHFIEFNHASASNLPIWIPDLHLRNLHGNSRVNAKLVRLYEDGTMELMKLMFAELDLYHPNYRPYPFDKQRMTVMVESAAHTTKQIVLSALAEFSGLERAHVAEWPGWTLVDGDDSVHYKTEEMVPDYVSAPGNKHRCERRSRYHLDIEVQRHVAKIITVKLLPIMLMIIITWFAFWVNVKVLMPRVAIGFISFLTLSNAATAFSQALPDVPYSVWSDIFFLVHRLFVMLALLETAICTYVTDKYSSRVGLKLDMFCRRAFPCDYAFVMILLFSLSRANTDDDALYEKQLSFLSIIMGVNMAALIILMLVWTIKEYRELRSQMIADPIQVHRQAVTLAKPLDTNEIVMFFRTLVSNGEGLLTLENLVKEVLRKHAGRVGDCTYRLPIIMSALEKKPAIPSLLDEEQFVMFHKSILSEISLGCTGNLEKHLPGNFDAQTIKICEHNQEAQNEDDEGEEEEEEDLGDPEEGPQG